MSTLTHAPARETTTRPTRAALPSLLTYIGLDLKRQLRDRMGMFFVIALPVFLFVVFGLGDDDPVGSGNVAMYVMISMAAYGAVTATTTIAGSAATEQMMGWGRQIALTRTSSLAFVVSKTVVAMVVAVVPIALIYAVGAASGARGNAADWALSALVVWAGAALFAIFGLAICLHFSGQNASSVASGMIVILAFLANLFSPMSGFMLDLGRFTPLYGYAGLARYPLTEGNLPLDAGHDSLWLLLANVASWTVIFTVLAVWGLTRRWERV